MGGSTFRRREKKFSKKMQRTLDPAMLLSRGLSARFVGANVMQSITTLTKEEIEKDLRHMNAYYQANVAYAQQHYIYMNREELGATGQLPGGNANAAAGYGAAQGGAMMGGGSNNNSSNNNNNHHQMHHPAMVVPPIAMPVRIDPEEEKRLQNLRKKIALCETQREFLESQYVSLRAHYVATTKELKAASKNCEGLVTFLQTVTKRRGRVLALQRARLQIARDVLACLQTRLAVLEVAQANQAGEGNPAGAAAAGMTTPKEDAANGNTTAAATTTPTTATKMEIDSPVAKSPSAGGAAGGDSNNKASGAATAPSGTTVGSTSGEDDIVEVWNQLEDMLKESELACRKIPSTLTISEKKSKKKSKKKESPAVDGEEEATVGVIPWDAIKMPNTPEGVPLLLSQLSLVPEKGAAYSTNGAFGCNKSSMAWMETSLPKTYNSKKERQKVSQLRDEVALLEEELAKERAANKEIQINIIGRRKRSDELVAMMTLLRSETEAILQRHNILLESPQAKQAARDLHEELVKARQQKAAEEAAAAAQIAAAATAANGSDGGGGGGDADADGITSGGSSNKRSKSSPDGKEKSRSSSRSSNKNGDDGGSVGDDEADGGDEYEEEGEVKGSATGGTGTSSKEWGSSKRDLDEGTGDDSSPSSRKRRKV